MGSGFRASFSWSHLRIPITLHMPCKDVSSCPNSSTVQPCNLPCSWQVVMEGPENASVAAEEASPFDPKRPPPVVRLEEVPQLHAFFPQGAPLLQLLVTAFDPQESEAAHLTPLQRDTAASIEVPAFPCLMSSPLYAILGCCTCM